MCAQINSISSNLPLVKIRAAIRLLLRSPARMFAIDVFLVLAELLLSLSLSLALSLVLICFSSISVCHRG